MVKYAYLLIEESYENCKELKKNKVNQ